MTASFIPRDLVHRLLAYEAVASHPTASMKSPALRVYEKLHRSLGEFVGGAGFHALASRALTLAKPEAPALREARIAADGSLQNLGQLDLGSDANMDLMAEGECLLMIRLLDLLRLFLGEALTYSLLRNAWPGEVFDDCNSAHGRKA